MSVSFVRLMVNGDRTHEYTQFLIDAGFFCKQTAMNKEVRMDCFTIHIFIAAIEYNISNITKRQQNIPFRKYNFDAIMHYMYICSFNFTFHWGKERKWSPIRKIILFLFMWANRTNLENRSSKYIKFIQIICIFWPINCFRKSKRNKCMSCVGCWHIVLSTAAFNFSSMFDIRFELNYATGYYI